jgi:hypothetical protein
LIFVIDEILTENGEDGYGEENKMRVRNQK